MLKWLNVIGVGGYLVITKIAKYQQKIRLGVGKILKRCWKNKISMEEWPSG